MDFSFFLWKYNVIVADTGVVFFWLNIAILHMFLHITIVCIFKLFLVYYMTFWNVPPKYAYIDLDPAHD